MTTMWPSGRRDALVIVAKYPAPGFVKTRLGASIGLTQSALLYRAFLQDLAARFTAASHIAGYDLIWACVECDSPMTEILGDDAVIIAQRGVGFDERLYAIARDVSAMSYTRTIILGSDSPQVPMRTIERGFDLLASYDVALGPAEDGGYYLVGLKNEPTPPDIFTGIEMSTPLVLAQTLARAHTYNLSVCSLEMTFDVDTEADLPRLALALDAAPALAPRTRAVLGTILDWATLTEGETHGAR